MKKVTIEVVCSECNADLFFKPFYIYENEDILISIKPHQCKKELKGLDNGAQVSLRDPRDREE